MWANFKRQDKCHHRKTNIWEHPCGHTLRATWLVLEHKSQFTKCYVTENERQESEQIKLRGHLTLFFNPINPEIKWLKILNASGIYPFPPISSLIRAAPLCCSSGPTFCVFKSRPSKRLGKPVSSYLGQDADSLGFSVLILTQTFILLRQVICMCEYTGTSPIGWVIQYKILVSIKLCLEGKAADCISEGEAECSVKTRAPAPHGFRS